MSKRTKQFIELEIQAPMTGQRFYREEDLPGFAIRVTRNSKSYILEKRVDGKAEYILDLEGYADLLRRRKELMKLKISRIRLSSKRNSLYGHIVWQAKSDRIETLPQGCFA